MNVVIVNSGVGNVRSVANMLRRLKVDAAISSDTSDILAAGVLILPGVGAFDACMERFREQGLIEPLNAKALDEGIPILGLCLGMQVMGDRSEEGTRPGLGWIPGRLLRLKPRGGGERKIRVPHMGWNLIRDFKDRVLFANMGDEPRFYFDHSFHYVPESPDHAHGMTRHGIEFCAGVRRGNMFGVQFHPEKSHRFGLALFENFLTYARSAAPRPIGRTAA